MSVLLTEQEDVEKIAKGKLSLGTGHIVAKFAAVLGPFEIVEAWRRELLGGRPSEGVGHPGGTREQRHPEFHQCATAHFGKSHLQHHLLTAGTARELQQVDNLRFRRRGPGNLGGTERDVVARYPAREDDRVTIRADTEFFTRKQRLEPLLEGRDAGIDDDVVLPAIGGAPDDETHRAWSFAVDQHFSRLNNDRVSNGRICHRNPRDVEVGGEHGRPPGRQRHPRKVCGLLRPQPHRSRDQPYQDRVDDRLTDESRVQDSSDHRNAIL